MRPLVLTIEAFGPFADREIIDFRTLGSRSFFLIHGPTGSGKSTIFDAMCYALYGERSGSSSHQHVRSDYANTSMATKVTFDFALGDKRYRVERSPAQVLDKVRGEGTREVPSKATFYRLCADDTTEVIATKNVKKEIEDVVGLDASQFRKVVLLPQGDFSQLLLATSTEREAILAKLFSTDVIERVTEILHEKYQALKTIRRDDESRIEGLYQAENVSDQAGLIEKKETLATNLSNANELFLAIQKEDDDATQILQEAKALAKLYEEMQKAREEQQRLQEELPQWNERKVKLARLHYVAEIKAHVDRLTTIVTEGQEIRERLDKVQSALEKVTMTVAHWDTEKAYLERVGANEKERLSEIDEKKRWVETWHEILTWQRQLASWTKEQEEDEQALQLLQQEIEKLEAARKEQHEQFVANDVILAQRETIHLEQENRIHEREALVAWLDLSPQIVEAKTAWEKARDERVQEAERVQQLHDEILRYTQQFETSQLAHLATTLIDGVPCPLCGSTNHPAPHTTTVADIPPMTDALWQKLEKAQEQLTVLVKKESEYETRYRTLKEKHEAESKKWDGVALSSIDAIIDELSTRLMKINQLQEARKSQEEALTTLEKTIKSTEERAVNLQRKMNERRGRMEHMAQWCEERSHTLPEERNLDEWESQLATLRALQDDYERRRNLYRSESEQDRATHIRLQSECTDLQQQREQKKIAYKTLQSQLEQDWKTRFGLDFSALLTHMDALAERENLQRDCQEYDMRVSQVTHTLKEKKEAIGDRPQPDVVTVQARYDETHNRFMAAQAQMIRLQQEVNRVAETETKIKEIEKRLADSHRELQLIGGLSELASGTGRGVTVRINFQRYVLSALLDQVLLFANQRLAKMTGGRYTLVRVDEAERKNSAAGLEIHVHDANTGRIRPAATLSGGESFLSSLSLALGLSDVAQSYAGGLHMDTVFIDEGFGTLDGDILDEALKTLIDLQRGGRMVGIISHVEALQRRIETRLEVVKTMEGSHTHWVFG